MKACCTAPSLNPNNPHIKDPCKSEKRALFSPGLLESCAASKARGAPGAGGLEQEEALSLCETLKAPDRRVLAYCSAGTQRGKRAHADVCGEGVPRVQPWARQGQACPSLGLRRRASAASSPPCERQSRVGGWVSTETKGLSSRLGAKWPPRTRFTTGPKHKGKENPKR